MTSPQNQQEQLSGSNSEQDFGRVTTTQRDRALLLQCDGRAVGSPSARVRRRKRARGAKLESLSYCEWESMFRGMV